MLSAEYFKKHFLEQFSAMGSGSAFLVLRNGGEIAIQRITAAEDSYLTAFIYAQEIVPGDTDSIEQANKSRKKEGSDQIVQDQIAIGYDEISYVRLTVKSEDPKRSLGFNV